MTASSQIIAAVSRGPLIESIHRGHIAVVDYKLSAIASVGFPEQVIFARSAAKLLQAIPVIESGAADRFAFTEEQIAILCASHNGEAAHIETVKRLLHQMNLPEQSLLCGAHAPYYEPEAVKLQREHIDPGKIHNNCSGKHSGMLALALQMNVSTDGYVSPDHPVQRFMLQTVSEMTGMPFTEIVLGTDGCGVPVFGMPLSRLAYAFARLGRPESLSTARQTACNRILNAIRKAPHMLAGTGRFDTRLIQATNGRIIGKMGAEGVFAITVPENGWGIAVKIEDGSQRALYPAAVEALLQLDLLSQAELEMLAPFHRPAVHNWEGTEIGRTEPVFHLIN